MFPDNLIDMNGARGRKKKTSRGSGDGVAVADAKPAETSPVQDDEAARQAELDAAQKKKDYFKVWYKANSEKIRAKRREAYHGDTKGTGEKVRQRCLEYKARVRDGVVARKPNKGRMMRIRFNGSARQVWTIGFLAQELDRSLICLNDWVLSGLLPSTPFETDGGLRLYTREMIDVVQAVCGERNGKDGKPRRIKKSEIEFTRAIETGWDKLGIFGTRYEHVA